MTMNKTSPTGSDSQDPRMTRKDKTRSCSNCFGDLCCFRGQKKRSTKSGNKPKPLPQSNNVKPREKDPQEDERRTTVIQEQPSSDLTDGTSCSFEEKMKNIRSTMKSSMTLKLKLKVGIFTRSAECDYEWLKKKLESERFHKIVETTQPFPITNSGSQKFLEDLASCKFGILYHTKNRGRINITDVTDSLYDMELQYLSEKLEKKNVIVVIDDLTDSSEEHKENLLQSQPSLKKWAKDVFLFTTEEKGEK